MDDLMLHALNVLIYAFGVAAFIVILGLCWMLFVPDLIILWQERRATLELFARHPIEPQGVRVLPRGTVDPRQPYDWAKDCYQ